MLLLNFALLLLLLSQEDEVPSDFQDYSLVTLVGVAAHLMHVSKEAPPCFACACLVSCCPYCCSRLPWPERSTAFGSDMGHARQLQTVCGHWRHGYDRRLIVLSVACLCHVCVCRRPWVTVVVWMCWRHATATMQRHWTRWDWRVC